MTMIEKVARATYFKWQSMMKEKQGANTSSFEELTSSEKEWEIASAKAVIEAMRDYHDNMNAESEATGHGEFSYKTLIDAALKE